MFFKRSADEGERRLLQRKVDQLERQLEQLRSQGEQPFRPHYEIHIHQLSIDKPVVESLLFRLDQLGIEDLSGSLNLGNNFLNSDKPPAAADDPALRTAQRKDAPTGPTEPDPRPTKRGFKVHFPSK